MQAVVKITVKCLLAGLLLFVIANQFFFRRSKGCGFGSDYLSISTVTYGPFIQYIPQTGDVETDTIYGRHVACVNIDELYLSRISVGLPATTTFNNTDYKLQIEDVSPVIVDGRFSARLCFDADVPRGLSESTRLRLRIQIGDSSNQILLPVGGFYKDTGGTWVFVFENDQRAVRRNVVLGRKAGSEYFEVLSGLAPGERVITSSYENFGDREFVNVNDLGRLSLR
jgi:hypothetical protein